jgi:plastocyanin
MRNLLIALAFVFGAVLTTQAQDSMKKTMKDKAQIVALEQTKGQFTQQQVELKAGDYVFAISNNKAGVDVGFVLVPKGADASNPDNHIKAAYVTQVVAEGATEKSNVVHLEAGEYVYFCPLNKTPQYTLTVK